MIVATIQLTAYFPDSCVEECSLTVVSSTFSPCSQKKHGNLSRYKLFYKHAKNHP